MPLLRISFLRTGNTAAVYFVFSQTGSAAAAVSQFVCLINFKGSFGKGAPA